MWLLSAHLLRWGRKFHRRPCYICPRQSNRRFLISCPASSGLGLRPSLGDPPVGRGERKKEPHLSLAAVTCFPGRRENLLPRWVFDPPDHNAMVSDLAGLLVPSRFWAPSCPGSLMCPVAEKWVCSSVGAEGVSWPVEGVEQRFWGLSCTGHLFRACLRGGHSIDSANLAFLRSPELSRSGHYRHAVALRVAPPSVSVAAVPVPVTCVGRFKHTSPGAEPPLRRGGSLAQAAVGQGGGDPRGPRGGVTSRGGAVKSGMRSCPQRRQGSAPRPWAGDSTAAKEYGDDS